MSDARGRERVRLAEQGRPGLTRLAQAVCLAVRVEPALLRRARLALTPELDAGAESDLWFGPLVGSRSTGAVVLDRDAARVLRAGLAADPARLDEVRELVCAAHLHEPAALQAEEEIIYLSLRGGPGAEEAIGGRVASALNELAAGGARALEVARWADRALPGLPPAAVDADAVRLLAFGAAARLGPSAQLVRRLVELPLPRTSAAWILPASEQAEDQVGVRLQDGVLEVVEPGFAGAAALHVGSVHGRRAEVRWQHGGTRHVRPLVLIPGAEVQLEAEVRTVTLRTLDGGEYLVRARPRAVPILYPPPRPVFAVYVSAAVGDYGPALSALLRKVERELGHQLGSERQVKLLGPAMRGELPGPRNRDRAHRALSACHAMLVVVSPQHRASPWCQTELTAYGVRAQDHPPDVDGRVDILWQRGSVYRSEAYDSAARRVELTGGKDGGVDVFWDRESTLGPVEHTPGTRRVEGPRGMDLRELMVRERRGPRADAAVEEIVQALRREPLHEGARSYLPDLEQLMEPPLREDLDPLLDLLHVLGQAFHTGEVVEWDALPRLLRLRMPSARQEFEVVRSACEQIFARQVPEYFSTRVDPIREARLTPGSWPSLLPNVEWPAKVPLPISRSRNMAEYLERIFILWLRYARAAAEENPLRLVKLSRPMWKVAPEWLERRLPHLEPSLLSRSGVALTLDGYRLVLAAIAEEVLMAMDEHGLYRLTQLYPR